MNKKTIGIILLIVAVCLGAGVAFALHNQTEPEVTAGSTSEENSADVSAVLAERTTTGETTEEETATEPMTQEEGTAAVTDDSEDNPFINNGVWYLFDDNNMLAYAFEFTDDDDVTIAFFNTENVMGGDAKFFTGSADYEYRGNQLVIDDVPDNIEVKEFVFDVQNAKLIYDKQALQRFDNLKLEHAFNHFNE